MTQWPPARIPRALPGARLGALVLVALALAAVTLMSLRIGSIGVTTADSLSALFNYSPDSYEQTVVRSLRLPRTVIGLGVGAALAMAGAALQAATRNPLAAPSILGVNSGAAFGVVSAVFFVGLGHPLQFVWFAFAGGLAASAVVYAISSAGHGGVSPVKLVLAGVVVSALLGSWLTGLLLLDRQALDVVRFWLAGSLAGRDMTVFLSVLPFLAAGIAGVSLLGNQLNVLSLGEDSARSLGMRTGRMRGLVIVLVVMLAGGSVAVAGPIAFLGLAVPHMVRIASGPDYRWVLAFSLLAGPLLLLGADIVGRVVIRPSEVQVGIITAIVGAPFLVLLARQRRVSDL